MASLVFFSVQENIRRSEVHNLQLAVEEKTTLACQRMNKTIRNESYDEFQFLPKHD